VRQAETTAAKVTEPESSQMPILSWLCQMLKQMTRG